MKFGPTSSASAALGFLLLCGCTLIDPTHPTSGHYLGYVKVQAPPAGSYRTAGLKVVTVGARVAQGMSIGYTRETLDYVPLDTRIIIKVRNRTQADYLLARLSPDVLHALCIVVEP